jgi:hypothetical protein
MHKTRFKVFRKSSQSFLAVTLWIAAIFGAVALSVLAAGDSPLVVSAMLACSIGALIEAWRIARRLT